MKEAQSTNEQNPEILVLPSLLGRCGYRYLLKEEGALKFIRPTMPPQSFPRFHLIIEFKDGRLFTSFHLDLRPHRSHFIGKDVSQELERIISILKETEETNQLKNSLVSALNSRLIFGPKEQDRGDHEAFQTRLTHKLFGARRQKRLKGLRKEVWLRKKNKKEDSGFEQEE